MSKTIPLRVLAMLALFCASNGVADIIYFDVPDIPIFGVSGPAVVNLDLDDNGVVDFVFTSTGMQFYVDPQGANRVVMNLGGFVAALPAGMTISSEPPPASHTWSSSDLAGITACASFPEGPICIGEFYNQTAFMGVEFDVVGGSTHYGWVRLEVAPFFAGGSILDYAYESAPDQAIAAGAIPEPSTFLLTLFGLFVFSLQRRNGSRL